MLPRLQVVGSLNAHADGGSGCLAVAASPEPTSPLLASSDQRGTVLLWDMRQLGKGPVAEATLPGAARALAFVAGTFFGATDPSALLVSGSADAQLRAHDTRKALAVEASATVLNTILSVDASPDAANPRLASGGGTGKKASDAGISIWRVEAGSS